MNDSSTSGPVHDRPSARDELKAWLRDMVTTFVPALMLVLVLNLFVAQATRVEGQSMEPSLHNNQRLIIEKISYRFRDIQRGDIIVIQMPNRPGPPLIKRVIGLPNETIHIHGGQVYIDDHLLVETYLNQLTYSNRQQETVPPDSIFVLGDNRGYSRDSRSFGMVKTEHVIGKAWFCYWPIQDIGLVH